MAQEEFKHIVILTGAGISAESGLGTFRDVDGLWTKVNLEDVATPEALARNPDFVHEFYNARRKDLLVAEPNEGHRALARLEKESSGRVLLVTQNVDVLHEKAGSENVIHMHGEMLKTRCDECQKVFDWPGDLATNTPCPDCANEGAMRPHVVLFGEMPFEMGAIYSALALCDLFISIGTSGNVYPAAGFVEEVRRGGRAHTVELNLEPSEGATLFAECINGPATEVVPAYVERLLGDT